MKKLNIAILLLCVFAISSCKKSSSPQSIVGKWTFTNISGTSTNNNSTTSGQTTTYTFNSAINTLTATTSDIGSTSQNITTTQVSSEVWAFNSDGTYTISETYTISPNPSLTSTSSGTWEYLSNTQANNGFILTGDGSSILSNIANTGIYTIQKVDGNTLTIAIINADTNNLGETTSANIVLTFTKQS